MERMTAATARANALRALSDDHRKILVADARLRARGTSLDFEDLLHGAYERWMTSGKEISGAAETCAFLRGAIRSIASNDHRHTAMVRRIEGNRIFAMDGELDPISEAPDLTASQENTLLLTQLYELCAHDPDVQTFLMFQDDGAERADILRELGWNVTKYETVQKRKLKLIARLINDGKI